MRLFEILIEILLISLCLAQFKKTSINSRKILSVGLIIVLILHSINEGIRWQMSTAYLLSIIVLIVSLTKITTQKKGGRISSVISSILLIGISLFLSLMIPIFQLPTTTGKFDLGTSLIDLESNREDLGIIHIKTWFPIEEKGKHRSVYVKDPMNRLDGIMGMPGVLFSHLNRVETEAYEDYLTIDKPNTFPLVIYAHGAASTNIDNTALLQEIASHGYYVVAIDFDFSFERYDLSLEQASTLTLEAQKEFIAQLMERVVPIQSDYIKYVINQLKSEQSSFTKNIDFEHIALLGHSLGGATCSNIIGKNFIPSGIINIDGPVPSGSISQIDAPFLYISSYSPELSLEELSEKGLPDAQFYQDVKRHELKDVLNLFSKLNANKHWVRFTNAGHIDFTDMPYMMPIMTTKGYNKAKGHELKSEIILNFLNHYLKNQESLEKKKDQTIEWLS